LPLIEQHGVGEHHATTDLADDAWMAEGDMAHAVRDITDDEIAFFKKNGWVKLKGFAQPDVVAEILRRARIVMGETAEQITGGGGGSADPAFSRFSQILRNYLGAWKNDPWLRAFAQSKDMARVASRLRHDAPIRFLNDEILVKLPVSQGGKPTPYHQDFPHTAYDRTAMINIWIALVDLPPDRGAMRFLTGSHQAGPLGRTLLDEKDVVEQNPRLLKEYPLSDPLHMKPGDATVHGDLTIHGGPPNLSDTARWAYLVNLFDARARYTGAVTYGEPISGIEPGGLFDTDRYPLVNTGGENAA
jgi:hypothetical protein